MNGSNIKKEEEEEVDDARYMIISEDSNVGSDDGGNDESADGEEQRSFLKRKYDSTMGEHSNTKSESGSNSGNGSDDTDVQTQYGYLEDGQVSNSLRDYMIPVSSSLSGKVNDRRIVEFHQPDSEFAASPASSKSQWQNEQARIILNSVGETLGGLRTQVRDIKDIIASWDKKLDKVDFQSIPYSDITDASQVHNATTNNPPQQAAVTQHSLTTFRTPTPQSPSIPSPHSAIQPRYNTPVAVDSIRTNNGSTNTFVTPSTTPQYSPSIHGGHNTIVVNNHPLNVARPPNPQPYRATSNQPSRYTGNVARVDNVQIEMREGGIDEAVVRGQPTKDALNCAMRLFFRLEREPAGLSEFLSRKLCYLFVDLTNTGDNRGGEAGGGEIQRNENGDEKTKINMKSLRDLWRKRKSQWRLRIAEILKMESPPPEVPIEDRWPGRTSRSDGTSTITSSSIHCGGAIDLRAASLSVELLRKFWGITSPEIDLDKRKGSEAERESQVRNLYLTQGMKNAAELYIGTVLYSPNYQKLKDRLVLGRGQQHQIKKIEEETLLLKMLDTLTVNDVVPVELVRVVEQIGQKKKKKKRGITRGLSILI